jgi:lipopolysaccharide transport system permease protein
VNNSEKSKVEPKKSIEYYPDKYVKLGFKIWKIMISDIIKSRGLIWRLFLRDFNSRYKQTFLGITWAVIIPLASVGVFLVLNRSKIINVESINVPYAVYAIFGVTIWGIFASGLTHASNSLIQSGSIIVKINFPKITLVVASFGLAIVEFIIRFIILLVAVSLFQTKIHWQVIFLPIVMLPLILLVLGIGFILALASGVLRDIPNIVTLAVTFFVFLCPVFYPLPDQGFISRISQYNPLYHFIEALRELVFNGQIMNIHGFLWAALFSVVVFLIGWKVFFIAEKRIAERI